MVDGRWLRDKRYLRLMRYLLKAICYQLYSTGQ
jgi:hypothetical protein